MADDQIAEIPDTDTAPAAPQMVACQCRSTYHWRQDHGACPNPARWCRWCSDGGCVLARRADARRDARRSGSSRHGERTRRRRRGHGRHGGSSMPELPAPPTVPFPMLPPLLPMPMPMPGLPWPGTGHHGRYGAGGDASSSSESSSISSSDGSFYDIRRDPRRRPGVERMFLQLPCPPWM